jgi:hypothetical protein
MKKFLRLLPLSLLVIPMMTFSVYANGDGRGGLDRGAAERNPFGERNAFNRGGFGENRIPFGERGGIGDRGGFGDRGGIGEHGGFQTGEPGAGGTTAPIDGWLSLLLAAGLALGLKMTIDRNKALRLKNIEIPE